MMLTVLSVEHFVIACNPNGGMISESIENEESITNFPTTKKTASKCIFFSLLSSISTLLTVNNLYATALAIRTILMHSG